MMSYSEQQREAPANAPAITPEEWAAVLADLDGAEPCCMLCDGDFTPDDGPVLTNWGPFHRECADSHDSACGEPLDGEA